jgi:hypothetical protein
MNFSDSQKAWILLLCLIVSTGGGVFLTSYEGGAKWWFALISALITSASNVYHALNQSPKDKVSSGNTTMLYKKPQPPTP